MKERPILFSAPMVRAILAGTKTQTRRVVKRAALDAIKFCTGRADDTPAVTADLGVFYDHPEVENSRGRTRKLKHPEWLFYCAEYPDEGSVPVGQGYGTVGDRLWVRETCCAEELATGLDGVRFMADDSFRPIENSPDACEPWAKLHHYRGKRGATVPPIHMPRWASRINLEVTGVRVERLLDISRADAIAEGLSFVSDAGSHWGVPGFASTWWDDPVRSYQALWTEINGAPSWFANPWVWVIEFPPVARQMAAAA